MSHETILGAVQSIHYQNVYATIEYTADGKVDHYEYAGSTCGRCDEPYPCETLRALEQALEGE